MQAVAHDDTMFGGTDLSAVEKQSQIGLIRQNTYTAFRTVVEPFVLKFEDTQSSFQKKSSTDLVQSLIILRLCTLEPLVKYAPKIIQASMYAKLDALVFWVIKRTFFKHFCAGEDLDEVTPVIAKLHDANIGSILDYSAEGAVGDDSDLDVSAERIMETIVLGQTYDSIKFACLKACPFDTTPALLHSPRATRGPADPVLSRQVSALSDPRLLERLSEECERLGGFDKIDQAIEALNDEDRASLDLVLGRLNRLSAQARSLRKHHSTPVTLTCAFPLVCLRQRSSGCPC